MVEALRYKPEGRGFDSRLCHWNFSSTKSFQPHYGPGVDAAPNRNEYREYFLGGKTAGVRADSLTIFMCRLFGNLGTSTSWNPQGLSRPVMGLLLYPELPKEGEEEEEEEEEGGGGGGGGGGGEEEEERRKRRNNPKC